MLVGSRQPRFYGIVNKGEAQVFQRTMLALEQYLKYHGPPTSRTFYAEYARSAELTRAIPLQKEQLRVRFADEPEDMTMGFSLRLRRRKKRRDDNEEETDTTSTRKKEDTTDQSEKEQELAPVTGEDDVERRAEAVRKLGSLGKANLRQIVDMLMSQNFLGRIEFVREFKDGAMRRYADFSGKARMWLTNFRPGVIPEEWWNVIMEELFYRVDNMIVPLSASDIRLWYEWLSVWITTEVADRLRKRDMKMATTFVEDFQKFAVAWGPALETAIKGSEKLVRVVAIELIKKCVRLLISLIKTGVFFVIDIIIRVLKSIPYTFWLGYILGYVFAAVEVVVNAVI